MNATKLDFIRAYRTELKARYDWAQNDFKLDKFCDGVVATLNGANTWNHEGDAVTAAWKAIGGKGKPSKKALRAIPN